MTASTPPLNPALADLFYVPPTPIQEVGHYDIAMRQYNYTACWVVVFFKSVGFCSSCQVCCCDGSQRFWSYLGTDRTPLVKKYIYSNQNIYFNELYSILRQIACDISYKSNKKYSSFGKNNTQQYSRP